MHNIEETPSFSKQLPECDDTWNEDVSYVHEDCEGEYIEVGNSKIKKRKKNSILMVIYEFLLTYSNVCLVFFY